MGYFITFEGTDGSGKTTQIRRLAEHLESLGYSVLLTREPGGCPIADMIRSILLDANNRGISDLTEIFMYSAARAQHVSDAILPALKENKIVLCDRFSDATIAYQGAGRGIDQEIVKNLNSIACRGIKPDLTVLLDCDVSLGLKRARQRSESRQGPREERFELEDIEFHKNVRETYLELARNDPDRFLVIDGDRDMDEITETIISQVLCHRLNNKDYAFL